VGFEGSWARSGAGETSRSRERERDLEGNPDEGSKVAKKRKKRGKMEQDSAQKAEGSFLLRAGNLAAGAFNANVRSHPGASRSSPHAGAGGLACMLLPCRRIPRPLGCLQTLKFVMMWQV